MTKKGQLIGAVSFLLLAVLTRVSAQQIAGPTEPSRPALAVAPAAPAQAQSPSTPEKPSSPAVVSWSSDGPDDFTFFFAGGNFLGVHTEEITKENMGRYSLREPRGIGIKKVEKDSPAERAGLREGDVITKFDGETVMSIRKLNRLIAESAPEQTVRLTVSRNGTEQEISATLGRRGDFNRGFNSRLKGAMADSIRQQADEMRKQAEEWRRNKPEVFSMNFGMRRRLGITTNGLTDQLASYFGLEQGRGGVLVTAVRENSAAAKAGLKAGDVITAVDGEKVEGTGDLSRVINRKEEGEVTLTVVRDKKERTIQVTPERAESPAFEFTTGDLVVPSVSVDIPRVIVTPPRVRVSPKPVVVGRSTVL